MSTKKSVVDLSAIENELIDEILAKPIFEIDGELSKHTSSLESSIDKMESVISEQVSRARKQLLTLARAAIDKKKQDSLHDQAINTAQQAQEFIFNVIAAGNIQNNQLTSAFREGEDIPDEDLIAIANEILDLINSNEEAY